jgi:hypothetical protein
LAALAVPHGLADLAAFSPRQGLAQLDAGRRPPSAAEWNAARGQLQRALELDPRNPAHYETLARWYEHYAAGLPRTSAVGAAYLEQAAAHLRSALTLRPGSAYTWAALATVKTRLAQFDAELDAAITRAWTFGPREPEVQLALARISLQGAERLGASGRQTARAALTLVCSTPETPINARPVGCSR